MRETKELIMREITVISGKGGAGKTTITGALTTLLDKSINTDCDVDAADLFLLLDPEIQETHSFPGGAKAIIKNQICAKCNKCIDSCRFDAIYYNEDKNLNVNEYLCEGCGLCENICPASAITMVQEYSNRWHISNTRNGTLIHAYMKPGEENSGKLVSELRKKARQMAEEENAAFIINDGPPGIGCSAIAAVTGADLVLMVIEATKSGLHDYRRAKELVQSFSTPMAALINKFDISPEITAEIKADLQNSNIPLLAQIPFDKILIDATTEGVTFPEYAPSHSITESLKNISNYIKQGVYEKKQTQPAH